MIIPLAFDVRYVNSEESYDVGAFLGKIVERVDWEAQVYVAVVDTETGVGSTIKLRAVRDVSHADDYHAIGTITMLRERPDPDLHEIARRHANLDYLRALRDHLNKILED